MIAYLKTLLVIYLCLFHGVSIGKQIRNLFLDTQQAAKEFSTIIIDLWGEFNVDIQDQFLLIAVNSSPVSVAFV
jgi:hypothetical protein